ncbi:peptidoglycan DD-metalloendopeptidase family protein [Ruegeria sp. 2205SS24-7]|uniref:peptidoglycan DD-metalloendopeptidase family protein n=1 Tax=Ruegeria discodermiae TaxID=3064389 RepID=UPI00274146F7|nr:peptidoglycan DD-metalloendopeptidase family protein [Ruegeria sp. 2205SS24-7]MDP5219263.1 peptidoglycan DD-metalloendopeptidase family protein [Ruegeria sp. 2205SS24-7]
MYGRLLATLALAAGPAASDPVLSLPIDCELGETCYIQQFVDRDPGAGARDFTCGTLSYDGHKGTDFALPTLRAMQQGVDVRAAAPGIVQGTRNSMPDQLFTSETTAQVDGRECGNGVVLKHEDGWETQYCHMRQGSIRVKSGDVIDVGTVLGQVGLSGKTQFPHLHLSVRKDGQVVDPFDTTGQAQCGQGGDNLWADTPDYVPGALLDVGFAPLVPEYDAILAGDAAQDVLSDQSSGLVLYGLAYGGLKGDVMRIEIVGPDGPFGGQQVELERNRARFFRAYGKRLTAERWPAGTYTGRVSLVRDGQVISQKSTTTTVQ